MKNAMPSSIKYSVERLAGLMPVEHANVIANAIGDSVGFANAVEASVIALNLAGISGSRAIRLAVAATVKVGARHPLKVNVYDDPCSRRRDAEHAHYQTMALADMALLLDNPILANEVLERA